MITRRVECYLFVLLIYVTFIAGCSHTKGGGQSRPLDRGSSLIGIENGDMIADIISTTNLDIAPHATLAIRSVSITADRRSGEVIDRYLLDDQVVAIVYALDYEADLLRLDPKKLYQTDDLEAIRSIDRIRRIWADTVDPSECRAVDAPRAGFGYTVLQSMWEPRAIFVSSPSLYTIIADCYYFPSPEEILDDVYAAKYVVRSIADFQKFEETSGPCAAGDFLIYYFDTAMISISRAAKDDGREA